MSYETNRWIEQNRRRIERQEREDLAMKQEQRKAYEAYQALKQRRDALYDVPDRAKDAYIAMEDNFGPETVKDFINARLEDESK